MAQYIDKNKVEEILKNLWKEDNGQNPEHRICYNKAIQEVQCELDTLEVKEMDLEEELDVIIDSLNDDKYEHLSIRQQLSHIARHFFELGLKTKENKL